MKYFILSILTLSFISCLDAELIGYESDTKKANDVKFIPFVPKDSTSISKDSVSVDSTNHTYPAVISYNFTKADYFIKK